MAKTFIQDQVVKTVSLQDMQLELREQHLRVICCRREIEAFDAQPSIGSVYATSVERDALCKRHNEELATYKKLVDAYAMHLSKMVDGVIEHLTGLHPYKQAKGIAMIPEQITVAA